MKILRWEIKIIVSCRHLRQKSNEHMDSSGIVMMVNGCLDCKKEIDRMYFLCGRFASETHQHYKDCL